MARIEAAGTVMTMMCSARTMVQLPCRLALTAGPAAATHARRHVRALLSAWEVPVDPYTAALLTSELVTNAVKHATEPGDAVHLVISWDGGRLRVEVHDRSGCPPLLLDAPPDAEAGRGLMLLAQLAADWGYRWTVSGKAVYFILAPAEESDHA
jgi:anti-sigma regulatory factor (Ser/Thr protein kinase)